MPSIQRLAVAICSVGRADILGELIPHLANQTRPADRVVFVVTAAQDITGNPQGAFGPETQVDVLIAPKGLTKQRNAALDHVSTDCDAIVFFDDDFAPSRHALAGIRAAFDLWPQVTGMTGRVLADGIHNAGYSARWARDALETYDAQPVTPPTVLTDGLVGLYGCNMAFRLRSIGAQRFDESLPLYGWQEDIDFAARLPGQRIRTSAFAGVHRGAKTGRETSGRSLGYSQIANPWFLWRKGTMPAWFGLRLALRNMVANHIKLLRPEAWIDRKGRATGNWLALWDILRRRSHPERILSL